MFKLLAYMLFQLPFQTTDGETTLVNREMSLKQGGIADIFQMFYSINLKSRIIPTLQSDDMPTCAHHSLENFLRVSTSDKRITFNVEPCRLFNYCPRCDNLSRLEILTSGIEIIQVQFIVLGFLMTPTININIKTTGQDLCKRQVQTRS